eukprot:1147753-Pelagomonas_calceolata.AAC.10
MIVLQTSALFCTPCLKMTFIHDVLEVDPATHNTLGHLPAPARHLLHAYTHTLCRCVMCCRVTFQHLLDTCCPGSTFGPGVGAAASPLTAHSPGGHGTSPSRPTLPPPTPGAPAPGPTGVL